MKTCTSGARSHGHLMLSRRPAPWRGDFACVRLCFALACLSVMRGRNIDIQACTGVWLLAPPGVVRWYPCLACTSSTCAFVGHLGVHCWVLQAACSAKATMFASLGLMAETGPGQRFTLIHHAQGQAAACTTCRFLRVACMIGLGRASRNVCHEVSQSNALRRGASCRMSTVLWLGSQYAKPSSKSCCSPGSGGLG